MSVEFLCSRTKMMPVADLKPHPDNPWDHGKKQIAMLRAYIEIDGWRHPIIIDQDSGFIAGGHLRRLVAMDMGLQEVPVDIQKFKSPARLMAFLKADNEIGNLRKLDPEKDTLFKMKMAQLDPDLNIQLEGIGDFRLETAGLGGEADQIPDVEATPTRAKSGDLWMLGAHRLLVGDCTKNDQVFRLLDGLDKLPCLTLTDPPYSVDYDRSQAERGGDAIVHNPYHEADLDPSKLLEGFLSCVPSDLLIMSYPIDRHFQALADALKAWEFRKELVWVKNNFSFWRGAAYQQMHEPILILTRNSESFKGSVPADETTVQKFDRPIAHDQHPTAKPLELWAKFVHFHAKQGDLVYDPFGGSGTTLIACEQSNRRCVTLEIEPRYADVIIYRWEKLSGRKAERANAK